MQVLIREKLLKEQVSKMSTLTDQKGYACGS
jgi:hypothetical protein